MPRTRSLASGADVPRSSISFAISGVARSFFLIASILLGPNPRRVYFPGVRPHRNPTTLETASYESSRNCHYLRRTCCGDFEGVIDGAN